MKVPDVPDQAAQNGLRHLDYNNLLLIDDTSTSCLAGKRLRSHGPQPTLVDSEALAIEVVDEYLILD